MLWPIAGGIFVTTIGVFLFLKPHLFWELTERWKSYRADEPSDLYLKVTKSGGVLFALPAIFMIILPRILAQRHGRPGTALL